MNFKRKNAFFFFFLSKTLYFSYSIEKELKLEDLATFFFQNQESPKNQKNTKSRLDPDLLSKVVNMNDVDISQVSFSKTVYNKKKGEKKGFKLTFRKAYLIFSASALKKNIYTSNLFLDKSKFNLRLFTNGMIETSLIAKERSIFRGKNRKFQIVYSFFSDEKNKKLLIRRIMHNLQIKAFESGKYSFYFFINPLMTKKVKNIKVRLEEL